MVAVSVTEMYLETVHLKLLLNLPGANELTHWGRDKMDAISQMTFSSAFSWMKMFEFQLRRKFVPKGPINNIPALV